MHEHTFTASSNGFCTSCSTGYQQPEVEESDEAPYLIANAGQLYWFAEHVNNAYLDSKNKDKILRSNAKLTADIIINDGTFDEEGVFVATGAQESSTPRSWVHIGTGNSKQFKGHFDGQNHVVSGLYIYEPTTNEGQGLFGDIYYATIENVGVVNSYIHGNNNVGAICGYSNYTWSWTAKSYIRNCWNTSRIKGVGNVCGILGYAENATSVSNCWNSGKISSTGNSIIAGIVGNVGPLTTDRSKSELFDCYNIGEIVNPHSHQLRGISQSVSTNCYTLGNYSNEESSVHKVSSEQFANGEVCFLLNHASSTGELVWHQDLNTQVAPQLVGTSVVYRGYLHPETCSDKVAYSNEPNKYSTVRGGHHYVNGFCEPAEGEVHYEPAVLNGEIYEVSNAGQLYWISGLVGNELGVCDYDASTNPTGTRQNNRANVRLMNDIIVNPGTFATDGTYTAVADETPRQWMPIGRYRNNSNDFKFNGVFDGQKHIVSGLYYNGSDSYIALIGVSAQASWASVVKNVGIENSYLKGNNYVASIMASGAYVTVSNCYSKATIEGAPYNNGNRYAGGISASEYINHENCLFAGSLTGNQRRPVGTGCTNCYYINTVNINENQASGAKRISMNDFQTGKYTWQLNGSTHDGELTWRQTIGTDDLPTFNDDSKVVYGVEANGDIYFVNENGTLATLPLTDGMTFSTPVSFNAASASYERSNIKNQWGTIVLPFDVSFTGAEPYDFYTITKIQDNTVILSKVHDVLPAGTPAMLRINTAEVTNGNTYDLSLSADNVKIKPGIGNSDEFAGLTLTGVYTSTNITGQPGYFVASNTFNAIAENKVKIGAYRAYLSGSLTNGAKQLSLGSVDSNETTAIEVVDTLVTGTTECYDISGNRISGLKHGVNVVKHNGKMIKVIIK